MPQRTGGVVEFGRKLHPGRAAAAADDDHDLCFAVRVWCAKTRSGRGCQPAGMQRFAQFGIDEVFVLHHRVTLDPHICAGG